MWSGGSVLSTARQLLRSISTSASPLYFRQKIAFKTRYHWLLDLCKSRKRARFPWIPREPPQVVEIDGQSIKLPEMNMEFIVPPDLDKCDLKPYVAWQSTAPIEEALTPEKLFEKKYIPKMRKVNAEGISKEELAKQVFS